MGKVEDLVGSDKRAGLCVVPAIGRGRVEVWPHGKVVHVFADNGDPEDFGGEVLLTREQAEALIVALQTVLKSSAVVSS